VALGGFHQNLIYNFKILAIQLPERQIELWVEAIQDILNEYNKEGKDETIRG